MTETEFNLIADILKSTRGLSDVMRALTFANEFKIRHPEFNPVRFLTACGVLTEDDQWRVER